MWELLWGPERLPLPLKERDRAEMLSDVPEVLAEGLWVGVGLIRLPLRDTDKEWVELTLGVGEEEGWVPVASGDAVGLKVRDDVLVPVVLELRLNCDLVRDRLSERVNVVVGPGVRVWVLRVDVGLPLKVAEPEVSDVD